MLIVQRGRVFLLLLLFASLGALFLGEGQGFVGMQGAATEFLRQGCQIASNSNSVRFQTDGQGAYVTSGGSREHARLNDHAQISTVDLVPIYMCRDSPVQNPPIKTAISFWHTGLIQLVPRTCANPCATVPGIDQIDQDAGDPIFLHSGELYLNHVDLGIPGRGFNWRFERTYASLLTFNGPLGYNWEFSYDRRVIEVNSANFQQIRNIHASIKVGDVMRPDGYARADFFEKAPDGSFRPRTGLYIELAKTSDGGFIERDAVGTKVMYARPDAEGIARMLKLTDRRGNTMNFLYNDHGQLVRVLDTLGRPIDYIYNPEGRLIEVRDFFNRSIRFKYDANGDLIEVTSPAVTGTPNGNDFPNGKTTHYTYSSGFAQQWLNHNLLTITAPNEVAIGGPPRLTVTYDTNPNSPFADSVLSQTIGGTNGTGIPAGGTIRYQYKVPSRPIPEDFTSAVYQTTVTDRNNNITEYQFNRLYNIVGIKEFTNRQIRSGGPSFFESHYEYNKDGQVIKVLEPEGNSIEYVYDDKNPDRLQQGNLLSVTRRPDPKRGGDQQFIKTTYTYEPLYNQMRTVTDARGIDSNYVPQNGGANSPARYTTVYTFDYQEGTNFAALAQQLGISEAEVRQMLERAGIPMGLGDVNGDRRADQINGNVIRVERPTVVLLPACPSDQLTADNTSCSLQARMEGTSQQPIVGLSQYNQFGQMLKHVDPEGNVNFFDYYPENDPDGDGKDLTPGVSSGPFGYLKQEIRDAESNPDRNSKTSPTPAQIKHRYSYDRAGNVIKEINGRGIATEFSVNQLNQVVEIMRAASVSEALNNPEEPNWRACFQASPEIRVLIECRAGMLPFRYRTRVYYDFNDNVVKREIENRDSNNKNATGDPFDPGDFVEYTFSYDILDNLIEETKEVSENPREILTTKYRYDRNENSVLKFSPVVNLPQDHPDRQPSNIVSYVYDERDLLFTSTRGGLTDQFKTLSGNADIPELRQIPNSPYISTFAKRYDGNRNMVESVDGADKIGAGKPQSTLYFYDGFDRQVSVIDAVGNQSFTRYDPASNVILISKFGPAGGPSPRDSSAATFAQPLTLQSFEQPLLSQAENKYDELGRMFERNDKLFVYQGVQYKRTPALRDGPLGQSNDGSVTTRYEYDRNSRQTFTIEDDLDVYETHYDGVDRAIRKVDPELNEVLSTYDDDNNVVKTTEVEITQRDKVKAGKVPDLKETFTTINVYDSLNRLIRTTDNLGQTTRSHYDSRENLVFTSDAQYSKDDADLILDPLELFPAAGQDSRGVTRINKPGNTMEYFYDGINRKISEVHHLRVGGQGKNPIDTSNPANPDGLIVNDYQWDPNSRLVAMADDGSTPGDQNTSIGVIEATNPKGNVTRYKYDDLNRLAREIFDDQTCNVYTYDADDNLVRMYDENGSIIKNTYDGINRLVRKDIERATSAMAHPAGCFKE
ncbi:hypothetical protein HYR54_04035 [Candidatus Acetothermia bacterium]|nr:hypothetical protein [Candidatus Acetothermia bacterium]